jgi:hypothetical protein
MPAVHAVFKNLCLDFGHSFRRRCRTALKCAAFFRAGLAAGLPVTRYERTNSGYR